MELSTNVTTDSLDFKTKFFYGFIDDTYSDWNPDFGDFSGKDEDTRSVSAESAITTQANEANQLTPENVKLLERKENHPVYLMVRITDYTPEIRDSDNLLLHILLKQIFTIHRYGIIKLMNIKKCCIGLSIL